MQHVRCGACGTFLLVGLAITLLAVPLVLQPLLWADTYPSRSVLLLRSDNGDREGHRSPLAAAAVRSDAVLSAGEHPTNEREAQNIGRNVAARAQSSVTVQPLSRNGNLLIACMHHLAWLPPYLARTITNSTTIALLETFPTLPKGLIVCELVFCSCAC